jgi:hypothetical protein
MPGSYQGPYPAEAEAAGIITTSGEKADLKEFRKGRVRVAGKTVSIGAKTAGEALRWIEDDRATPAEGRELKVALVEDVCLLVYRKPRMALIAVEKSEMFARYIVEAE